MRRPSSFVNNGGRDDVDTFGFTAQGRDRVGCGWSIGRSACAMAATPSVDRVGSAAWTQFTDVATVIPLSRGQYLDGARYVHGGVFAQIEARPTGSLQARAGARLAAAAASARAEPLSGTAAIDTRWLALVGNLGMQWRLLPALVLLASYDRSFRAPNLDDLTSRQQTGPGFQFENPALRPETADTFEVGLRLRERARHAGRLGLPFAGDRSHRPLAADHRAMPAGHPGLRHLVVTLPAGQRAGSVPDRRPGAVGPTAPHGDCRGAGDRRPRPGQRTQPSAPPSRPGPALRVPGAAVPGAAHSTAWSRRGGPPSFTAGQPGAPAALPGRGPTLGAWQRRLHPTDLSDARIPEGGTPGFVVLDVRAGLRVHDRFLLAAVLENLTDAAYRYHGSSVNGPGRGVIVNLEAGL